MCLSQRIRRYDTYGYCGYACVSSVGQSLDIQIDKLNNYGCTKVFQEKRSGKQQIEIN